MPQSIRPLLTVWEETDLDKLAKIADKMLDAVGSGSMCAIAATSSKTMDHTVNAMAPATKSKDISDTIRTLSEKVDNLQRISSVCFPQIALAVDLVVKLIVKYVAYAMTNRLLLLKNRLIRL